ncbi:MAG: phage tail assembly chaperone [Sphingorhabdus sp.]
MVRAEKWTLERSHHEVKQVQGDDLFMDKTLILGGQTAILLGWRPDDFWSATPAELTAIFAALLPQTGSAADSNTLINLMEQFPDAPPEVTNG